MFGNVETSVLAILDAIASTPDRALGFAEMRKHVGAQQNVDEELLRGHLELLCMDHYLVRNETNQYRFYLELVRRWWRIDRSL